MKSIRVPTSEGGDWWVLVHSLALRDRALRQVRPIHVFTLLAQHLAQEQRQNAFRLGLALENKLAGVSFHLRQVRSVVGTIGEPIYAGTFVKDYADHQALMASLEAFLNAVYSALELSAMLSRTLHPDRPVGFRRQAKRGHVCELAALDWLRIFLDLRTELTHFGTTLPSVQVDKQSLIVEFTTPATLEFFARRQRYEIPLSDILKFGPALFDMLDAWAIKELAGINRNQQLDIFCETGRRSKPKARKVKVGSFLKLIAIHRPRSMRTKAPSPPAGRTSQTRRKKRIESL